MRYLNFSFEQNREFRRRIYDREKLSMRLYNMTIINNILALIGYVMINNVFRLATFKFWKKKLLKNSKPNFGKVGQTWYQDKIAWNFSAHTYSFPIKEFPEPSQFPEPRTYPTKTVNAVQLENLANNFFYIKWINLVIDWYKVRDCW